MAKLLEDLEPGTAVFVGEIRVGEIRAVYAERDTRRADYLAVRWDSRDLDVLVATSEVESLEPRGVVLGGTEPETYATLAGFDERRMPQLRKLR
ncbi:MAG: hypothetical protein ABI346_05045 [Candidatus Baltobacteraceae bacterium]|jgi:hypothetical protein